MQQSACGPAWMALAPAAHGLDRSRFVQRERGLREPAARPHLAHELRGSVVDRSLGAVWQDFCHNPPVTFRRTRIMAAIPLAERCRPMHYLTRFALAEHTAAPRMAPTGFSRRFRGQSACGRFGRPCPDLVQYASRRRKFGCMAHCHQGTGSLPTPSTSRVRGIRMAPLDGWSDLHRGSVQLGTRRPWPRSSSHTCACLACTSENVRSAAGTLDRRTRGSQRPCTPHA